MGTEKKTATLEDLKTSGQLKAALIARSLEITQANGAPPPLPDGVTEDQRDIYTLKLLHSPVLTPAQSHFLRQTIVESLRRGEDNA